MKTSDLKITQLKLATYNPRKISDKDLANLKKSLERFGFVQPIVVNKDRTVIGGHQRIRAWKEMGNYTVPVLQIDITKKEEKALNLALNRISGEWDSEKLFEVINDLRVDETLDFTGFDEKEVSKILDQYIEDDEEETVEQLLEKAPAKAKRGDVYELGNHRLMCGDSTSEDDVKKLTGGKLMDMIWTDPPYNVNYESSDDALGKIKNDHMSEDAFSDFMGHVFLRLWESTRQGGGNVYLYWVAKFFNLHTKNA